MKILLTAIAMMIVTPALAQTAPAAAHADHSAHAARAAPSGQAAHAGHSSTPAADPHAGHDMSGGMDCCKKDANGTMAYCAKMKAEGKAMPCCDKMKAGEKKASAAVDADPHDGHKMPAQ